MSPDTVPADFVTYPPAMASTEDTIMTPAEGSISEPITDSGPTLQGLQNQINTLSGQLQQVLNLFQNLPALQNSTVQQRPEQ